MDATQASRVLRADAVLDLLLGALLLLGSWDGLYDALDLPQGRPSLLVQVGGIVLIAFAYLLWVAPTTRELTRHVAAGAALANAAAAALIALWLIVKGSDDLGIDTLGVVLLAVTAAVLALFALAEARIFQAATVDLAKPSNPEGTAH